MRESSGKNAGQMQLALPSSSALCPSDGRLRSLDLACGLTQSKAVLIFLQPRFLGRGMRLVTHFKASQKFVQAGGGIFLSFAYNENSPPFSPTFSF